MKRLLAALLLVASPALAQENGWQEIQNGWGEIQTALGSYATMPAPVSCASGEVPYFNASLQLVCSPTVYAPATDTTTATGTIAARNLTAAGLATPTITSPLTVNGTPGATTYGYKLTARAADSTTTAASAEVTIATGNATLDGTNNITVAWPAVTGAATYKLYRTTGGAAPPKLIYTGALLTFTDIGAAGTAETPSTVDTTGVVTGDRVAAGAGGPGMSSLAFGLHGFYERNATTAELNIANVGKYRFGSSALTAFISSLSVGASGTITITFDDSRVKIPALAAGIATVSAAASGSISVDNVRGTLLSNYGQGAENTSTLPAAASGYNFVAVVSTAGAGAWHIKAAAGDKLYLDGTALDDGDKASLGVPAVGNTLTCVAFQTGATAWDWICTSGGGAVWSDGGA